jgi:hypothetical protein
VSSPTARLLVLFALLVPAPAQGHHEAIFGPQASMVFAAPAFVSLQAFHKANRADEGETTTLLSAGLAPGHHSNASVAIIVPVSFGHHHSGIENIVVGGRYRLELKKLQDRLGKDGNYLLFMGGMEIPNGNVDRPSFSGNVSWLTAVLYSLEWRTLSVIGYGFYRFDADGDGDRLYAGVGLAYTPYDKHERLISLQIGASHETLFAERRPEPARQDTGWQLMINPTVMFAPHAKWRFFVTASVAAVQRMATLEDSDRWRVGAGVVYVIGGHAHD